MSIAQLSKHCGIVLSPPLNEFDHCAMKCLPLQDSRHDNKRHLRLRNGLITRHAYSVTGLARVRGQLGN